MARLAHVFAGPHVALLAEVVLGPVAAPVVAEASVALEWLLDPPLPALSTTTVEPHAALPTSRARTESRITPRVAAFVRPRAS